MLFTKYTKGDRAAVLLSNNIIQKASICLTELVERGMDSMNEKKDKESEWEERKID